MVSTQGRQAQEKAHKPMVFNFNKDLIRAELKDERKWAHEMVGAKQFRDRTGLHYKFCLTMPHRNISPFMVMPNEEWQSMTSAH